MNRALRKIIHPDLAEAERDELRRAAAADLALDPPKPIWIATAGGAAMQINPSPKKEPRDEA